MSDKKDNVIDLSKVREAAKQISDGPVEYPEGIDPATLTPADAIAIVLNSGSFNEIAMEAGERSLEDGGAIEVRVIAHFKRGAFNFFSVAAAHAYRQSVAVEVDQKTCKHHWRSLDPSRMQCQHCDLTVSPKEWAEQFGPKRNIIIPD